MNRLSLQSFSLKIQPNRNNIVIYDIVSNISFLPRVKAGPFLFALIAIVESHQVAIPTRAEAIFDLIDFECCAMITKGEFVSFTSTHNYSST